MINYVEETLKFFESRAMREYLLTRSDWLDRNDYAKIVSFAPASLESKIPVLELIAEQTEYDPKRDFYDPAKMAELSRAGLDERYNNPTGTVFVLRDWWYSDKGCYYEDLFTEFEAAMRCIHEHQDESTDPYDSECLSFTIEKYIPADNGKMELCCKWVMNYSGEIWYFNYAYDYNPNGERHSEKLHTPIGDLNFPVPFQAGDIIEADCRPFAEECYSEISTALKANHTRREDR
jgi:hypothetical protein